MLKIVYGAPQMNAGRGVQDTSKYEAIVKDIIKDVYENGDTALLKYARKFDCESLESLKVTQAEIDEAVASMDESFMQILREAKENIESYHKNQKRAGFNMELSNGVKMGQVILPLESVGAYVPGGTAAYPSSVFMNLIPAKIAGVKRIVLTTPAGKDGKIPAPLLAAASLCGVNEIYKTGGAQAVAALAFGTDTIPRVDKVVGPGNIYVTLAKKQLFGTIGVDMTAGPSEILILADEKSNPAFVAADLLSQAEHDKLASAILVTNSETLAKNVNIELERQLSTLPRNEIAAASLLSNGCAYIVKDMDEAVEAANLCAPEHLEICVDDPFQYLPKIRAAGSIFLGRYTPEPLADYMAGPNHVLPTGGSARFFSPLSVDDFVKKSSYLYYTEDATKAIASKVAAFARSEGLEAHARSALIRAGEDFSK